jgi:hypothetical protein
MWSLVRANVNRSTCVKTPTQLVVIEWASSHLCSFHLHFFTMGGKLKGGDFFETSAEKITGLR